LKTIERLVEHVRTM